MPNQGWTAESNEGVSLCADVSVAANEDGRLEIYTYENVGAGRIWHKWQEWDQTKTTIIGWSNWDNFNASEDRTYFNTQIEGHKDIFLGLTANGDSCLQLVTQGAWGVFQKTQNGVWGGLSRLGSPPSESLLVTAIGRSNAESDRGALYVFAVDQVSFNVQYAIQKKVGGAWSWKNLGHPADEGSYAVRLDDWEFRSQPARIANQNLGVGSNQDGRIEIFYGSPLKMWHIWQTSTVDADQWIGWTPMPYFNGYQNIGDWAVIQNGPSQQPNIGKRLEVFALSSPNQEVYSLWHCWQKATNGNTGWTGWEPIPGLDIALIPFPNGIIGSLKGPIRAARQADGSITIFAIGTYGGLHYIRQNGANASFREAWVSLGGEGITAFDVGQNKDGTLEAFIVSGQQVWHRKQTNVNSDDWDPQ